MAIRVWPSRLDALLKQGGIGVHRIPAERPHLEVQVRTRDVSRRTYCADGLAWHYDLPGFDEDGRLVAVPELGAICSA
jgi:hypothetical protein